MKKLTNKFLAVVLMTAGVSFSYAQVRIVNSSSNTAAPSSSAFIDASSNVSVNNSTNVGKGLLFPRTDLTTFVNFGFSSTTGIPSNYPTNFDGLIVYNTASSGVAGVGSTQGTLTQGYWFYENKSGTLNGGTWKPVAAAANTKENILTTETVTNRQINSAQVYGIKGTFAASGTSTSVTIPAPTGMTAMYAITIYKAGSNTVYSRELYSYDPATGAAVTGSPSMSVVYPNGTYDYVLEYLK
ncbi:hypothetical protein [Chryseobacterium culicis]|jgi:hypothetical protein|uniref:hypothetical protein n=1 Tax=Chryseobacterium culicis TaxID=680127 RepID=UPI0028993A7A|nr:hypothetical protein [Chryseobacterium culicis]